MFSFRAGTALTTLDNNGRTPLQLAQSKLKLLQRNQSDSDGMSRVRKLFEDKIILLTINIQVKQEVSSILEMMTEYLKRVTDDTCGFENLIQSFSQVSAFLLLLNTTDKLCHHNEIYVNISAAYIK